MFVCLFVAVEVHACSIFLASALVAFVVVDALLSSGAVPDALATDLRLQTVCCLVYF